MFQVGDIIKDKDINKCAIIVKVEYTGVPTEANKYSTNRYHLKWLDKDYVCSVYSEYLMELCMVKVNE